MKPGISTANALADATPQTRAGTGLLGLAGFSAAGLVDGLVEAPWRSASSATLHQIVINPGAVFTLDLVALFGCRSTSGAAFTATAFASDLASGNTDWQTLGTVNLNSRGDGAIRFASRTARRLALDFDGGLVAFTAEVGEVWAGVVTELPEAPVALERAPLRAVTVVESVGGSAWRTKRAEKRLRFALPMPPLTTAEADAAEAIVDAVEGSLLPVTLLPDIAVPGAIYHGILDGESADRLDLDGYWMDRAFVFTESGRLLRHG